MRKYIISLIVCIIVCHVVFPCSAKSMTIKEEERLGREFMRVTRHNYDFIDDPMIVNYVQKVGEKIISVLPSQPFAYHFYVVKNHEYNAFAGPAGHVFINSGLLEAMTSEDELAGILSHEISHVVCRHISEMIDKSKKTSLATLAGLAASIFLGVGGAATAASAVAVGSIAVGQSMSLAYSRDNEMQADQVGLKYLAKAGYSADGLLTMLKKIRSKSWTEPGQVPTYLLTHPAVEDRISYINDWIATHTARPGAGAHDKVEFKRMSTILAAKFGDQDNEIKIFKRQLLQEPGNFLANWGMGLVLMRKGDYKGATNYLMIALTYKPFDPYVIRDLGNVYFLEGLYEKALGMLNTTRRSGSDDPEAQLLFARTLQKLGKLKKASETLQDLIAKRPEYTKAYYRLGEVYGVREKMGLAHYYLGIFYKKKGQLKNALFHLRTAEKYLKDKAMRKKAHELQDGLAKG